MPVQITSVAIKNKFRSEPVDWLLANVGDEISIELDCIVKSFVVASTKNKITINATDGFVGAGWVNDPAKRFGDFKIGDAILFFNKANNSFGDFTIIDKIDDGKFQLDSPFTGTDNNTQLDSIVFSIRTPITGLKYKYNFIENNDNTTFKSLIDGTDIELICKHIDAADHTPLSMIFIGEKSYQTGSATAQGVSIEFFTGVYVSSFKIIHNTKVTPYMLSKDWDKIRSGIQPDYFFNDKCLKAIFDIKAARVYTDPNWIETEQITSVIGNTGGYGENFNTGLTNYKVDSLIYTDNDTNVLPAVVLGSDETNFEIHIKNTVDSPFSNNNTHFELQFLKAPYDQQEYQINGRTIDENFVDDRVFKKVGDAPGNGDQFGVSGRQVLKAVSATFISSSEIKITGKIAMLDSTIAVFEESEEPRYIFAVEVQNHTLQTNNSDLTRLIIDASSLTVELEEADDDMIQFDHTYIRHYEEGLDGSTDGTELQLLAALEDEIAAKTRFSLDRTGRESDDIAIKSVIARIKSKNSTTGEEFILDNFKLDFTGIPFLKINGYSNQDVDFTLDRVFLIPEAEIRKPIKISRRTDLDQGAKAYYQSTFPFLVRWEYWLKLMGVPGDFYDTTLPNKGLNNNWLRYANQIGWGVYYELQVIVTKNKKNRVYKYENNFPVFNYDSNPAWDPNTIKSFDPDTLDELYDPTQDRKFLLGTKDTLIRADFTRVAGAPDLSRITVNMHIEVFEEGGIEGTRRMSSKWPSDDNTWFRSLDASHMTKLSLVGGNTVRAEVLVNKDLLPDKQIFSIASRLYEKFTPICVKEVGGSPAVPGKFYAITGEGYSTEDDGAHGGLIEYISGPASSVYNGFGSANGSAPNALFKASDGMVYGITAQNGDNGFGALFKLNPATNAYTILRQIDSGISGMPVQLGNKLYFAADGGGANSNGLIWSWDITAPPLSAYTPEKDFPALIIEPPSDYAQNLIKASDGNFYGITSGNSVYQYVPGGAINVVHTFTETILGIFFQHTDLSLYIGTAGDGGTNGGSVIKLTLAGTPTTVHTFTTDVDGQYPVSIIQHSNGNVYGVCNAGGSITGVPTGSGNFWQIIAGVFSVRLSFGGDQGTGGTGGKNTAGPTGIMEASTGNIYGLWSNGSGGVDPNTPSDTAFGGMFSYDLLTNIYTRRFTFPTYPGCTSVPKQFVSPIYAPVEVGGTPAVPGTVVEYPCACNCPEGFEFDPVNSNCKASGTGTGAGKAGNKWYFGIKAGLDFDTLDANNNPTPLTDGLINTQEGCTSISDPDGNFLFASDGIFIYDGTWTQKADDLKGNPSSTQSAVAILKPGTTDAYYLFTVDSGSAGGGGNNYGMFYNELNGVSPTGLNVFAKNVFMYNGSALEKLCARKNLDGTYWVIAKEFNVSTAPNFIAFKIATDGTIDLTPVKSLALVISNTTAPPNAGQMKISPDGFTLVDCKYDNTVQLYDFDETTGIISNGRTLTGFTHSYGAEFSPSSKIIYISDDQDGRLSQFDLNQISISDVKASKVAIGPPSAQRVGALQLAPNGKIYVALAELTPTGGANYLGAIDTPNTLGVGCGYNELMKLNADPSGFYNITTHGQLSFLGLPTFELSNIINTRATVPCPGSCIVPDITVSNSGGRIKIIMNDVRGRTWAVSDDKTTTPINISSNKTYLFGTYTNGEVVQLTLTDSTRPDCLVSQTVHIVI